MLAKKKSAGGAPEWALTYGDMMSLLLCFFILLAAFADYEKGGGGSEAVMAAMQSIQQALGIKAINPAGTENVTSFNAMVHQMLDAIKAYDERNKGNAKDEGVEGKSFRLRRIRDGMEIAIGGSILFEPFSPELTPEGRDSLNGIIKVLKGHRNKVDIIGHAAERPMPADWTYQDAMELSYARARCVGKAFVERGIDPRTIRLVAAGANEPAHKANDPSYRPGDNRRVEVVVRESMIDDYQTDRTAQIPALPLTEPASRPGG